MPQHNFIKKTIILKSNKLKSSFECNFKAIKLLQKVDLNKNVGNYKRF